MENNYKTFMDKQHPSEDLIADTISKARELSAEENAEESSRSGRFRSQTVPVFDGKWAAAFLAAVCLIIAAVWQWNTGFEYAELTGSYIPNDSNSEQRAGFGEERNSYLGAEEPDYYVFDGEARVSDVKVGQGTIKIQIGTVEQAGRQSLYETVPKSIKGHEVYTGKIVTGEKVFFYAAFELEDKHYYLEGENVTEREMTAYIRDLLK